MDNPLVGIPITGVIVLIALAFGRRMLRLIGIRLDSALEKDVFGAAIGLGVAAYLTLAVGLAGVLYPWVLAILLLLMAAMSLGELKVVAGEILAGIRGSFNAKLRIGDSLITLGLVSLGACALIGALAPPAGVDWDALAYHLAIPNIYLAKHAIFYVPYISHSNFPFLTEMLYTIGLAFKSISSAKLFHFAMFILTGCAVYVIGKRHVGPLAGKVGALLFMASPVVLWEAGAGYADITTACYLTLAVFALLNWERSGIRNDVTTRRQEDKRTKREGGGSSDPYPESSIQNLVSGSRWLWLCGLMCGFALSTKALAGVPVAGLCFWALISEIRSKGWVEGFKSSLGLAGIALVIGSPWYIKSFVYTGNPVYPFLYNIFGGKNWNQADAVLYRNAQLTLGMGRGIRQFIMVPWNLAMNGYKFFDTKSLFGIIGCAFLGLMPITALDGKNRKAILKVGMIAILFATAWFFLMQQNRYLISVLPLFALIAGAGVQAANGRWRHGRFIVNGFAVICVLASLFVGVMMAQNSINAAIGLESRDDYLSRNLGGMYDAEKYLNDSTPESAKVALFGEVRGFWLDREYIWANPGHHELIPWKSFKTGVDMVAFLRKAGYTYALINWQFSTMEEPHMKFVADAIGHGLMQEVYSGRGASVYELVAK
jgi:4-amino-4-deoxy-L-arabinose transferase-like glycosyltransferase